MKKKCTRSVENMIIYTDPDFPLTSENIYHSCLFYKSWQDFEKKNEGMQALIIIPKGNLPRSKRKKKTR
jgi:hypothetical protein